VSETRLGCTFSADGRINGGRRSLSGAGRFALSKGDAGSVVKENGEGAVGGGR